MKKHAVMILAAVAALALAGCKEDEKPQEVVQTVEWFKEHSAEREAQLAKCKSNPGELAATPNCVNASRADSSSTWSKRGGIKAPAPLTAEDINKK
ncbi:EexN family lipoprotein [Pseudomonas aeruginosa]